MPWFLVSVTTQFSVWRHSVRQQHFCALLLGCINFLIFSFSASSLVVVFFVFTKRLPVEEKHGLLFQRMQKPAYKTSSFVAKYSWLHTCSNTMNQIFFQVKLEILTMYRQMSRRTKGEFMLISSAWNLKCNSVMLQSRQGMGNVSLSAMLACCNLAIFLFYFSLPLVLVVILLVALLADYSPEK